MKSCLRCGTELERNPVHNHWHHCPTCEPIWTDANRLFNKLLNLHAFATFAATDRRGTPTRGGVKE